MIRFEQVGFRYGDREVLAAIDFTIPAGRTVAVVGSTGASGMDILAGTGVGILVICILLVFFGGALFAWSACRTIFAGHDRPLIGSTLCALALVLAGEVLSRLMFYGSYLRIGL